MYCKFQVYAPSTNTWSDFGKVCSPLDIGESIKADLAAAYSIKLYFNPINTTELTPGTFCRINMNTRTFEFVVIDGGEIDPVGKSAYCYHVYSVQEIIAYAREIYVQKGFFSFSKYTFPQFITRLFALSKSNMVLALSTSESAYQLMLDNWQSPDYQISSNILLDNLIKIGSNLQTRLKARIGATGTFELYAKKLKGYGAADFSKGKFNGRSTQYKGSTFASKAVANVENMTTDQYFWFPGDDKLIGMMAEPDNDGTAITEDNAVLNLHHKINDATFVRIMGFGDIIFEVGEEIEYYYDENHVRIVPPTGYLARLTYSIRNKRSHVIDIPVYDHRKWILLDPDGTNGATRHQKNTLYFKDGETKIYNIKICNFDPTNMIGIGFGNDTPCFYTQSNDPVYIELQYARNYYAVYCNLYSNSQIDQVNHLGGERVTIYSQSDNIVSGKTFIGNMKDSIDSMQNVEDGPSYLFDDIDDVPLAGQIYDGKVISDVALRVTYSKIKASFVLSDDLVAKSEYASADAGLVLPAIPIDKAYDRITNYQTKVWFCATLAEAQAILAKFGADTFFDDTYHASDISDAFENGRSSDPITPREILIRAGDVANTQVYSAGMLNVVAVGNSILMVFNAQDPAAIGVMIDDSAGTNPEDLVFYPIGFVDINTAQAQNFRFKIVSNTLREIATNYPRISSTNFTDESGYLVIADIDDQNYYHDPAERPTVTYQLSAYCGGSVANTISQILLEEMSFLKDCSDGDTYTRYVQIAATQYEIDHVTLSYVSTKLWCMKIYLDITTGFSDGQDVAVRIFRKTGTAEEDMMNFTTSINIDSGQMYLLFYLPFTK